jgi:hypothetical protein
MASTGLVLLSPAETAYIEDGVGMNFRADGRQCGECLPASPTLDTPAPAHERLLDLTCAHTPRFTVSPTPRLCARRVGLR